MTKRVDFDRYRHVDLYTVRSELVDIERKFDDNNKPKYNIFGNAAATLA
jgi:hypothetical protein